MKKKKRHPDHDDMTWGKQDMTAFLKHVPLMALCLIGCTHVSSFAETVDGNDTGGVLHLEGGTYGEIIGRGSTVTISYGHREDVTHTGADVLLTDVTATRVFGAANYISPSYGLSLTATSEGNSVTADRLTLSDDLYGAMSCVTDSTGSSSAVVKNNTLSVENSSIAGSVYGQEAVLYPGSGENAALSEGGEFLFRNSEVKGNVYGGVAAANVINGTLSVSGGTTVLENATVGSMLVGGYAQHFLSSGDVSVTGTRVVMNGDSASTHVTGGSVFVEAGRDDIAVEIADNVVELNGGTVSGNVYASFIHVEDADVSANVHDNVVILRGSVDLARADLAGFVAEQGSSGSLNVTGSGNGLVVDGWSGSVNNINNFDYIKFTNIPWEHESAVMTVKGDGSSLQNTIVDLRESTTLAGGQTLHVDDYMYFIRSEGGDLGTGADNIVVDSGAGGDNVFTAGVAFEGTGKVTVEEDGSVRYTITGVKPGGQTNIVTENSAVSLAFLTQGADLVVDGLHALEREQSFGVKTFAIVEGAALSYDLANDLDIDGWNGLYGVGNLQERRNGTLAWAAFLENGMAHYRKHYAFLGDTFLGTGDISYYGGGVAARYAHDGGFYVDASLRAGILENDADNVMRDGTGASHGYETEAAYYGFHAGLGRLISLGERSTLDVYGRWHFLRHEGDDFSVCGDRFDVDAATSSRFRFGTRYSHALDGDWSVYVGAAWDYETDGHSSAVVNGVKLPEESLKGGGGLGEIGFRRSDAHSPWSLEGRLRGYVGEREGVSGMMSATWRF